MDARKSKTSEKKDRTFIADLKPNQDIVGTFAVASKELRTAKNGMPYLTLTLQDKTGQVTGRIWNGAEEAASRIASQCVVRLQGRTETFRDVLQINIQRLETMAPEHIDLEDFLPAYPGDAAALWQEFVSKLATVQQKPLKELVRLFLADNALMTAFRKAPAAKNFHHAYLGGLLEHTTSVMELVSLVAGRYATLDRELLLVGAFLHDIGKVYEFRWDMAIDYSDVGRLVGHMVLGVEILEKKLSLCKDFPQETAVLLKHLILSHHGQAEYGAVQPPMTREAFVLHLADDLDAKMNNLDRILEQAAGDESRWTSYQKSYARFFYKGGACGEETASDESVDTHGGPCRQLNLFSMMAEKRQEGRERSGP
ncbi:3'-5' exoribonuclease [Desulfacinum hydrothermale DSM 13146]|uniref:3'-5' exoribonuclease n=1 Tax=Desulfacinum hydrothermale DSM 13146 TaxID=1121390 RepID=A0A1W1XED7_9BACT|nr:HD domain-containing protein [Desulfacinum hydrothermale]SMC22259.1 3'-5' exoribonuclease [Desulfacinum hydrothermale DSM 13146]